MNWSNIDAFETTHAKGINAIMVVDISSRRVVMSNGLALEYFSQKDDVISLQKILGRNTDVTNFFSTITEELSDNLHAVKEAQTVQDKDEEDMLCNLVFTYATPAKQHVFMKIHPILDNKPYYLEKFIETRSRPAFTLNINEKLTVNHGNPKFYQCFACNKTSMKLRYKNSFGNLLADEFRKDYEDLIYEEVKKNPMGRLDIPVQTALGEVLWFYYDTTRLRQVESDPMNNLFCLLVSKDDSTEDLNNPFDNA